MKNYKIKDYIDLLIKHNLLKNYNADAELLEHEIEKVTYNSKDVNQNTLFVCKGLKYKAEYLKEAISNGAIIYIADEENITIKDFPHIVVTDIRKALAVVATLFYNYPALNINMIGVTGTKGKSTTSYYIKSILDDYMKKQNKNDTAIISSIDTYDGVTTRESLLTCPESLELQSHIRNAVNSNMENLVMEVSSQALKLSRVYGILYKVGVFLNISEDHISSVEHEDFDDYFYSKLKLFDQIENAVINLDSECSDIILEHSKKCPNVLTCSTKDSSADIYAYNITKDGHTAINFKIKSNKFNFEKDEFTLTMPGLFNVENALVAIGTAICLNIPYDSIYDGLKIARASGRMETHSSKDGSIIVIVDYAHNKLSFEKLYESTKQEYPDKKIVTVYGCPGGKAQRRRMHLGELSGRYSDISYLTAEDPGIEETIDICKEIAFYIEKENGKYKIVEDRGEAIKQAILENTDSVVLITGKGNETRQKYGTTYVPCLTDTDYALQALEEYDKITDKITNS